MMEEQLIQVNKKIKQIQGVINKRKQKVNQWNLSCNKVLEQKSDKSKYLSRVYNAKINFKSLSPQDRRKVSQQLNQKASLSRIKVKEFYNQLKDLDYLQKQKNKIHLIVLEKKKNKTQHNKLKIDANNKRPLVQCDKNLNNQTNSNNFCRTVKDRVNPFQNIRAGQLIQFSQQMKNNSQNIGPKLMKHFGVGLQTTPLGSSIVKQQRKQEIFNKNQSKKKTMNKMSKTSFGKAFHETFNSNQKIFGMTYHPRNIFQDRLKKIIKYHGDFWGQQFNIN